MILLWVACHTGLYTAKDMSRACHEDRAYKEQYCENQSQKVWVFKLKTNLGNNLHLLNFLRWNPPMAKFIFPENNEGAAFFSGAFVLKILRD